MDVAKKKTLAILSRMGILTQMNEGLIIRDDDSPCLLLSLTSLTVDMTNAGLTRDPLPQLPNGGRLLTEYMDTYVRPTIAAKIASKVGSLTVEIASKVGSLTVEEDQMQPQQTEAEFVEKISELLNISKNELLIHMNPTPEEVAANSPDEGGAESPAWSPIATYSPSRWGSSPDPYHTSSTMTASDRIRLARRRSYTNQAPMDPRDLSPSPSPPWEDSQAGISGLSGFNPSLLRVGDERVDWESGGIASLSVEGITYERSPSPEPPIMSIGVMPMTILDPNLWPSHDQV